MIYENESQPGMSGKSKEPLGVELRKMVEAYNENIRWQRIAWVEALLTRRVEETKTETKVAADRGVP